MDNNDHNTKKLIKFWYPYYTILLREMFLMSDLLPFISMCDWTSFFYRFLIFQNRFDKIRSHLHTTLTDPSPVRLAPIEKTSQPSNIAKRSWRHCFMVLESPNWLSLHNGVSRVPMMRLWFHNRRNRVWKSLDTLFLERVGERNLTSTGRRGTQRGTMEGRQPDMG